MSMGGSGPGESGYGGMGGHETGSSEMGYGGGESESYGGMGSGYACRVTAAPPGGATGGRTAGSDRTPYDLPVEVYGMVYIYNPVDMKKLGIETAGSETSPAGARRGSPTNRSHTRNAGDHARDFRGDSGNSGGHDARCGE